MPSYVPLQPPIVKPQSDALYSYQEFTPSKELRPYVACYWSSVTHAAIPAGVHRVVPDGCVDIIVDLQASTHAKAVFIAGFMTSSMTVSLPAHQSMFGIRFYLDHAHRFMRGPVSTFVSKQVYLEDSWGRDAALMVDAVTAARGMKDRLTQVEQILKNCVTATDSQVNVLQASMAYIYERKGVLTVRELADQACYSERHVRRAFMQQYGISPKEVHNIVRFQFVLRDMYQRSSVSFADVAVKFGYYDQSHLNQHFKRYYGMPPRQVFVLPRDREGSGD